MVFVKAIKLDNNTAKYWYKDKANINPIWTCFMEQCIYSEARQLFFLLSALSLGSTCASGELSILDALTCLHLPSRFNFTRPPSTTSFTH